MDKTHHGPVITIFFLCKFGSFFSYFGGIPVTNYFSLLLIDRYILTIHKEHLRYSLWYVAIFWTSSDALAPWSWQQKLAKTASKSFLLSSGKSCHFFLLWCMHCTATPDISSSSENMNSTACVSRLSFRFLWLWNITILAIFNTILTRISIFCKIRVTFVYYLLFYITI